MTTEEFADSIKRINKESDVNRIKLMTLRAAYLNMAENFHVIEHIRDRTLHVGAFRSCSDPVCEANMNVLRKLDLL